MELMQRIRNQPGLAEVPVVILTPSVYGRDRIAAHIAGANRCFEKPVRSRRRLSQLIYQTSLNRHSSPASTQPRDSATQGGGKLDHETASLAQFRVDPDPAVHPLNGPAHDCKSDARARVAAVPVQSLEDSKDSLVMLPVDADALIDDP